MLTVSVVIMMAGMLIILMGILIISVILFTMMAGVFIRPVLIC